MTREGVLRARRELAGLADTAGSLGGRANTLAGNLTAELAGQKRFDRQALEDELGDLYAESTGLAVQILRLWQALK